MTCDCRSDARRLAVVLPDGTSFPELEAAGPAEEWSVHAALGTIVFPVGTRSRWSGVAEVANFLRALLDPSRFADLRGAWIRDGVPLEEQLRALLGAEPLSGMAAVDSSPLAGILEGRRRETWFQPIVLPRTAEVWGYECLVRGRTEDGELVGAPDLLRWARQERLVFMFDRLCRETHLRNAGAAGLGPQVRFLVNFLPTAIYRPEFCLASTVRVVREAGLVPSNVIFEVVETERIDDVEHLRRILSFYREQGFRVALDDVGSGYSGLAMLGDLDPDLLKIDRELVRKAPASRFHRGICASLAGLARENGRLILAEGVETEEERAVMEEMGVDLLQGYLFGRPAPIPVATEAAATA